MSGIRTKCFVVAAGLFFSAVCSQPFAQEANQASQRIYDVLAPRLISEANQKMVGTTIKANQGFIVSVVEFDYRALRSNKAIAACIDWNSSNAGFIQAAHSDMSINTKPSDASSTGTSALEQCVSRKNASAKDCDCALVDENDRNVLHVPESFLARYPVMDDTISVPAMTPETASPRIPLTMSWEGANSPMSGTIRFSDLTAPKGPLLIELPLPLGICRGSWTFTHPPSPASPTARGYWDVRCANGETAAGVYEASQRGSGTCKGYDSKMRAVSCTYGLPP